MIILFYSLIGKKNRNQKKVNFRRMVDLVKGRSGETPRTQVPFPQASYFATYSSVTFPGQLSLIFKFLLLGPLPAHYDSPYDMELNMTHTQYVYTRAISNALICFLNTFCGLLAYFAHWAYVLL